MSDAGLGQHFALDVARVGQMSTDGRLSADNASLKEAAKQFEALFMEKMLSSMRDAIPKSDLGRSSQTEFYESLMDKQWAQHAAGQGIGLAEQLVRQLTESVAFQGRLPASGDERGGDQVAANGQAQGAQGIPQIADSVRMLAKGRAQ